MATNCSDRASDPSLAAIARAWPGVDGSTSTEPLAVLIACKAHGLRYGWRRGPAEERTVVPSGERRPDLAARIVREVHHHGTHDAYTGLIDRRVELILVAREPSLRELAAAARAGVALDVRPFALDALVFVVNVRNPVRDLPLERLRAVYGPGGPERWTGLGGGEGVIEAFQREEDSGSQELIDQLVMRGRPMRDVREIPIVRTMAGPIHAVAMREAGLAFSVYYYVTNMARNGSVRMLGVDGIRPTRASIASRRYPLTSPVFAVLRKGSNPEGPAAKLRDWLGTQEGREALLESGYAPYPVSSPRVRSQGGLFRGTRLPAVVFESRPVNRYQAGEIGPAILTAFSSVPAPRSSSTSPRLASTCSARFVPARTDETWGLR